VIPVARNVWLQVETEKPAAKARRFTMRRASVRCIARGDSERFRSIVRNRGDFLSSQITGGIEVGVQIRFCVVWAKTSLYFPPFSMKRNLQSLPA
jgi:hypothetical protein